ncbi:MAG: circularly permuted type 2 ATP-grasp protein, partial [Planctomycetota bacterium]
MLAQSTGYDEAFDRDGRARPAFREFVRRLEQIGLWELARRQELADLQLQNAGITFNVYGHADGVEKVWPFDIVPRVIDGAEWERVDAGLKQRVTALNLFIDDVYNGQRIIKDGVVPAELVLGSKTFRKEMKGFSPTHKAWCHISGVDLVRDRDGRFYVLEDNLRCPSGVSYVLENREVMKRSFARVFDGTSIAPIEEYPERLLQTLLDCAPERSHRPLAVVLTPGVYNSAYFEHTFLAQQMGVELVQGSDLVVVDDVVWMRTTHGLQRVDVIYRRIDDDFLDPECFREDSCLGVPGLMRAYFAGNVTLANAP